LTGTSLRWLFRRIRVAGLRRRPGTGSAACVPVNRAADETHDIDGALGVGNLAAGRKVFGATTRLNRQVGTSQQGRRRDLDGRIIGNLYVSANAQTHDRQIGFRVEVD